jgi:hypothetical protein
MKYYPDLKEPCNRLGCHSTMSCYGTIDWCRQAREGASEEEWKAWVARFTEEFGVDGKGTCTKTSTPCDGTSFYCPLLNLHSGFRNRECGCYKKAERLEADSKK